MQLSILLIINACLFVFDIVLTSAAMKIRKKILLRQNRLTYVPELLLKNNEMCKFVYLFLKLKFRHKCLFMN